MRCRVVEASAVRSGPELRQIGRVDMHVTGDDQHRILSSSASLAAGLRQSEALAVRRDQAAINTILPWILPSAAGCRLGQSANLRPCGR